MDQDYFWLDRRSKPVPAGNYSFLVGVTMSPSEMIATFQRGELDPKSLGLPVSISLV
jgi:hypothetical protein